MTNLSAEPTSEHSTTTSAARTRLPRRLGLSMLVAVAVTACAGNDTTSLETKPSNDGATTQASAGDAAAATPTTSPVSIEPVPPSPATEAPTPEPTPAPEATATPVPEPTPAPEATATVPAGQTAVTVESTPEQYHVLFVHPVLDGSSGVPVALAPGAAGSVTLTDGRAMLPPDHYRVETFDVAAPGDVDGDGTDDLAELDDPAGNPLNPAPAIDASLGATIVPDRATYERLSYQGDEVARDGYLAGLEFVKFWIVDTDTDHPAVYFMNTEVFRAHPHFAEQVGIRAGRGPSPGKMRGDIVFTPEATAPDGSAGRFRFAFQPNDSYSFAEIALAYELLSTNMPMVAGNLMYYPFPQSALPVYEQEKASYDAYRVPVLVE